MTGKNISDIIGNTPMVRLGNIEKELSLNAMLAAKAEFMNPTGSVKDRAALAMIDAAERDGSLKPGGTIIEPTSGNTGIGLCAIAAARGYSAVIVMPGNMSAERRLMMTAFGARVVLSDAALGMAGAIELAKKIASETENSFIPSQFDNPANALAHYLTTGPEIYAAMDGRVDYFVAGVGSGGTLTGVGRFLREKLPDVRIVAAEPDESAVLSGDKPGKHGIQGIGAGFIPKVMDMSVVSDVKRVPTADAFSFARMLAKREGLLCGISSGAALAAAVSVAREHAGSRIALLLPDSGSRYLSAGLFEE